jgi:hypothetical protein
MSIIDKLRQGSQDVGLNDSLLGEDPFGDEYPGIFEMLTRSKWKGKGRKVGRLIMYAEPGRATLCLVDVEAGMVTFHTKETFGEALTGLEEALQSGSSDWRQDKRSQYRK